MSVESGGLVVNVAQGGLLVLEHFHLRNHNGRQVEVAFVGGTNLASHKAILALETLFCQMTSISGLARCGSRLLTHISSPVWSLIGNRNRGSHVL